MIEQPNDSERVAGDDGSDHAFAPGPDDSDRIVLRASALRWVWVIIGSMVFVALGAAMALGAETSGVAQIIGWILVGLFGFCAFVAVRQMVVPGSLVISHTSIEMIRRGRLTTFEFADCGPFTTWRNPNQGTVYAVFDHRPDDDSQVNQMNRRLMGGSRMFIDNYGMSADALAEVLNDVRRSTTDG